MATLYLEILAQQRPFPIGVDESNRTMYSVNFLCRAVAPVVALEDEIIAYLNSHGTLATKFNYSTGLGDAFVGPLAVIPATISQDGPFIHVIETAGLPTEETHNGGKYERPAFQLIIRAASTSVARTRALAVWRALDGVRNTTVAA